MTADLPSDAELDANPGVWAVGLLAAHGIGGGALAPMHGWSHAIWDGTTAALIDFEAAGAAPLDRELDLLLRFLVEPAAISPRPGAGSSTRYRPVLGWLRDAYPELFAQPRLVERLEVYDALWELVQLLNYPPDHPRGTAARLQTIVRGPRAVEEGAASLV